MLVFSATCFTLILLGAVDGHFIPDGPSIIMMKILESTPSTREFESPSICKADNEENEQETKIFSFPISTMNNGEDDLKDIFNFLQHKKDFDDIAKKDKQEHISMSRFFDRLPFRPIPFQPPFLDEDEQEPTINNDDLSFDMKKDNLKSEDPALKGTSFDDIVQKPKEHLLRSRLLDLLPFRPISIQPTFLDEDEQENKISRHPTIEEMIEKLRMKRFVFDSALQRMKDARLDAIVPKPQENFFRSRFLDLLPFRPIPIQPPFIDEDEQETKIFPTINNDDDHLRSKDLPNTLQPIKDDRFDDIVPRPQADFFPSTFLDRAPFRPMPIPFLNPDLRGYFLRKHFAQLRKLMNNVSK